MMFATFSPDGRRIAFVHKNNLYVQDLLDLGITPLTKDGSDTLINGTFDWVYEEELYLRNGFRWSPDSQFDRLLATRFVGRQGVPHHQQRRRALFSFDLHPLSENRRKELRCPHRRGEGYRRRDDHGSDIAGDPREHYLAKMEWHGSEIVVQQFNRLQNTNRVMLRSIPTMAGRSTDAARGHLRRKRRGLGRKPQRFSLDRQAASNSSGSANATAGSTSTSCPATARRSRSSPKGRSTSSTSKRSTRKAAGSTFTRRPTIRRSAISIASLSRAAMPSA